MSTTEKHNRSSRPLHGFSLRTLLIATTLVAVGLGLIVWAYEMNRLKYRKLRIAWSVAWGMLAVLLIALWVRSYWHVDYSGSDHGECDCIWLFSKDASIGDVPNLALVR